LQYLSTDVSVLLMVRRARYAMRAIHAFSGGMRCPAMSYSGVLHPLTAATTKWSTVSRGGIRSSRVEWKCRTWKWQTKL